MTDKKRTTLEKSKPKKKQNNDSPFAVFSMLAYKKSATINPKIYNPYMMNRLVAMSAQEDGPAIAEFMNELPHIPKQFQYMFLYQFVDRGIGTTYVKSATDSNAKIKAAMMIVYGINETVVEEYFKFIPEDFHKNILNKADLISKL